MSALSEHEVLRILRQVDGDRVVLETRHRGVRATTRVLLHAVDPRLDALVRAVVTTGRGSVVGLPAPVMEVLEGYRVRLLLGDQPWLPNVLAAGVIEDAPAEVGEQPPTGRGFLFITTRWMEGATLDVRWPELGEGARIDAAGRVAARLAVLHEARVAFGDLKPSNVVWSGGEVRLIDLDTLREVPGVDLGVRTTSATQEYAAPEQLHRRETYLASDVWAFGEMLSRLVTNRGERAPGPFWGPLVYRCRHPAPSARPRATDLARYLLDGVPLPEDELTVPVADVMEVAEQPVPVPRPKRTARPLPVAPAEAEEEVEAFVFNGPRPWVSRRTWLSAVVMVAALAVLGWTIFDQRQRREQACGAVKEAWKVAEESGNIAAAFGTMDAELVRCDDPVSKAVRVLRLVWPPTPSASSPEDLVSGLSGQGGDGASSLALFAVAATNCLRAPTAASCQDTMRSPYLLEGVWDARARDVRYEVLDRLTGAEVKEAFAPELAEALKAHVDGEDRLLLLVRLAAKAGTNAEFVRLAEELARRFRGSGDTLVEDARERCVAMLNADRGGAIAAIDACWPLSRASDDIGGQANIALRGADLGHPNAASMMDEAFQVCLQRPQADVGDPRLDALCKDLALRFQDPIRLIDLATAYRRDGTMWPFVGDLRAACDGIVSGLATKNMGFEEHLTCMRAFDGVHLRLPWARAALGAVTEAEQVGLVYSSLLKECPDVQADAESLRPVLKSNTGDPSDWCAVVVGRYLGCEVPLPRVADGCFCETTSPLFKPPRTRMVQRDPGKDCGSTPIAGYRCVEHFAAVRGGRWDALPTLTPPCAVDSADVTIY